MISGSGYKNVGRITYAHTYIHTHTVFSIYHEILRQAISFQQVSWFRVTKIQCNLYLVLIFQLFSVYYFFLSFFFVCKNWFLFFFFHYYLNSSTFWRNNWWCIGNYKTVTRYYSHLGDQYAKQNKKKITNTNYYTEVDWQSFRIRIFFRFIIHFKKWCKTF